MTRRTSQHPSPAARTPRTGKELLEEYADPAWRDGYLAVSDVRETLRGCVLAKGYTLPDDLNSAIALTTAGSELRQELVTKEKLNPKTATVLCLLTLAYREPLIDVLKTDVAALWKSVGDQLLSRKLIIPFRFGRELYDKAADTFDHEMPRLTFDESLLLLSSTSIGVAQMGNHVTGPFGVIQTLTKRWIPPDTILPLFHCSNIGGYS